VVVSTPGVQLAEVLQLFDREIVAGQVQQRVDQHRAVAVGQHEAVAVRPLRIARVVLQVPAPQRHGDVCHAHRRTGVAGIGLLDGVHGKHADGIGHQLGGLGSKRTCGGMGKGGHAGGFGVSLGGRKTAILAEARGVSGLPDAPAAESRRSSLAAVRNQGRTTGTIRSSACLMLHPALHARAAVPHFDSSARHA
jgi:hypothetical protein